MFVRLFLFRPFEMFVTRIARSPAVSQVPQILNLYMTLRAVVVSVLYCASACHSTELWHQMQPHSKGPQLSLLNADSLANGTRPMVGLTRLIYEWGLNLRPEWLLTI